MGNLKELSLEIRQDFQWRDRDTNPATAPVAYNLSCLQNMQG